MNEYFEEIKRKTGDSLIVVAYKIKVTHALLYMCVNGQRKMSMDVFKKLLEAYPDAKLKKKLAEVYKKEKEEQQDEKIRLVIKKHKETIAKIDELTGE